MGEGGEAKASTKVDPCEISDDAGIAAGLIRHYFGAKERLIDEASG